MIPAAQRGSFQRSRIKIGARAHIKHPHSVAAAVCTLANPWKRVRTQVIGGTHEVNRTKLQSAVTPTIEPNFLHAHPLAVTGTFARIAQKCGHIVCHEERLAVCKAAGTENEARGRGLVELT